MHCLYLFRASLLSLFVAAGVSVLLIALGTVSFHAVKAALSNPVKSLRTE